MGSSHRTRIAFAAFLVGAAALAVVIVLSAEPSNGDGSDVEEEPLAAASGGCPVSETKTSRAPGLPGSEPGWIVEDGLWINVGERATVVGLKEDETYWPPGTMFGQLRRNGTVSAKFQWRRDRRAWGRLRVSGRLMSGRGRPVKANVSDAQGPRSRIVPSTLFFPRVGCWRISARTRSAELTAVLRVVRSSDL